jgi:AraC-like DNA-binding protein
MALSVVVVRALIEGAERAGLRGETLLGAVAFDPQRVEDGTARISLNEYDALTIAAMRLTGDPALGLRMGESITATTYSLAGHLIMQASNLRKAIDAFARFHRLLIDQQVTRLEEAGETATLYYDPVPGSLEGQRFSSEYSLVGLARMVQFFGRGTMPRRVHFKHAAPAEPGHRAEYRRIFEGTERFGRSETAVIFDRALLDTMQLHADEDLHEALEVQAERRVSRLGRPTFRDCVVDCLLRCETSQRTDMSTTAQTLGVSVRSLRRRLSEEGASYQAILDSVLSSRAMDLLAQPNGTVDETAYALGFSDRRAFHRAFRRWTGTTPAEYRRKCLGE